MVINLAFWSAVSLLVRIIAIILFVAVAKLQLDEIRRRTIVDLGHLKRLLLACVSAIIISNLPIIYLHIVRIDGGQSPASITALATVTNAVAMLVTAVLMYLIYKYRGDDE